MRHNLIYLFLLLSLIGALKSHAASTTPDSIPVYFAQQQYAFPQEKIYAQTDKSNYQPGDTLWFRVFLVDASIHMASALSNFIYADLVDPEGELVDRVKIMKENGTFKGYIQLPENLHTGDYRLCVYSKYMHQAQQQGVFQKRISIEDYISTRHLVESYFRQGDKKEELVADIQFKEFNQQGAFLPSKVEFYDGDGQLQQVKNTLDGHYLIKLSNYPKDSVLHIRYTIGSSVQGRYVPIPSLTKDYHVSFFPEGGRLPGNTLCRIGFKALNTDGLGEEIRGMLLNTRGDTILSDIQSFKSGMGAFDFYYDTTTEYRLVCHNKKGLKKEFDLPAAIPDIYALTARWRNGNLLLSLNRDPNTQSDKPVYLTILCRGKVLYSKEWTEYAREGNFLRFHGKMFPTGILQVLLTDEKNLPLSERLVFNVNREEAITLELHTDKKYYGKRELVKADMRVLDKQSRPVPATLSVSVTDSEFAPPDTSQNILSTLLLTSELKGYIESPAYYFTGDYADKAEELDALLLTQGWSCYHIERVLQGDLEQPSFQAETSQQIKGRLYKGVSQNKPAGDYPVRMFAMETGKFLEGKTENDGSFCFDNILFADSTVFVVQGYTPKERNDVLLKIDQDSLAVVPQSYPQVLRESEKGWQRTEHEKTVRMFSNRDIARSYQLDEVEITATKIKKRLPFYIQESPYSSEFNKSVKGKELIERYHPSSVMDMLSSVTGIAIWRDGPNVYPYFPSENIKNLIPPPPAYLLMDNIPITAGELNSLMPRYIAEIEVIKHARTSTLGAKALSGAILITTSMLPVDQEVVSPRNIQTIAPLGYQVTKEFYSPVYETREQKDSVTRDNRSTIYWNPDIRTAEEQTGKFQFYTSDQDVPYKVVIEGLSVDGRFIYSEENIERK